MHGAIPTLAVLAAFNKRPVRFVGIQNFRVKECDRVEALRPGLQQLSDGLARVAGDELIVQGVCSARITQLTRLLYRYI